MNKSVTLSINITSVETAVTDDAAAEQALDRLPVGLINALHEAGFTVALPIDSTVRNLGPKPPTLFDDETADLDAMRP